MATTRKISLKEVAQHKSEKDVWIVLHNDVLDVTSFLAEHPGGERVIMDFAGKDASVAFEDVGHSHDAREIAAQYKIGWLPPPERRRFVDSSPKWKWALLVLAMAIIAGVAYKKYAN